MNTEQIIILAESVVLAIMIAVVVALLVKRARKPKAKADNVIVKNGVRYTRDDMETTESGDVKITHSTGDIILERGITYIVQKGGRIIPGKYTALSTAEGESAFNLRLGDFVRSYEHATDIVLSEGETVCAVSHNVILR